jgi:PKD repeat protein
VSIPLSASDPDRNPLTLRIVSQPAHGSAGLAGVVATYFPDPGFSGSDAFTFAAWDGSTNSNLATVTLAVGTGACSVNATATVPATAIAGQVVSFQASAQVTGCNGAQPSYDWDFGDGSPHSFVATVPHPYAAAAVYTWHLTVTTGSVTRTVIGSITVSAPPCSVSATATVPTTAIAGPATGFFPSPPLFRSNGAQPSYDWDFGDGSPHSFVANVPHSYATAAVYSWHLTVTAGSATRSITGTIAVADPPCSVSATATVPATASAGQAASFQASAQVTGCAGTRVIYDWNFGDGQPHSSLANASHTYGEPGRFEWRLRVSAGSASTSVAGTIVVGRRARRSF